MCAFVLTQQAAQRDSSQECRKLGVQCIVAPYEADAQLAYFSKEGIVDTIITEDSDLLVFGSKRVLFKLDESGHGKLIELKDLGKANKNLFVCRTYCCFGWGLNFLSV